MQSNISKACFLAILAAPLSATAMDVKGLELGAPYTEAQLSQAFPGTKCFPHGKTGLTHCSLPTTFLGRETSAEVMRDKKNRIIDFTAFLPTSDEKEAVQILSARFGAPDTERKEDRQIYVWSGADSGNLRVEAAIVNNQLRINFYTNKIAAPPRSPLQADDM